MADRRGRSVTIKFPCTATLSEVRSSLQKENEDAKLTVVQDLGGGEFLIEFENKKHAEDFIDSGVDFHEIHLNCNPPHGYYVNVSILGLRAYIDDDKVIEALSEYGEIKSEVIRLKYKVDHELAGLENGNRLVRMVLGRTSIPYSMNIDGRWCRIMHNNQQRVCTICHAVGHSRRKCPEIECRRCHNKGHIASDCPEPEQTTDITPNDETVTQPPSENTPDDITDPPVIETPQTDPEPEPQPPQQDNDNEQPSTVNSQTEEHMDDEDAQRGSSKRPHQTDSDSDRSAPRRAKIKPTPNLSTARRPKSKPKKEEPPTE